MTGEIQATLHISAASPEPFTDGELVETYYISLCDGSLISATQCNDPVFEVVIEGAAIIEVDARQGAVNNGWPVEWINLCVQSQCRRRGAEVGTKPGPVSS